MPTVLHGTFIRRIVEEIQRRLSSLASHEPQLRPYIEKIEEIGGQLELPNTTNNGHQVLIKHDPDAMFAHEDAGWPGVVIEVSYSQKRKDLPDLADDYILESDGGIGLVIGLDIEYRGSRKATVSTWQLKQTIDEQGEEQYSASPVIKNQVYEIDSASCKSANMVQIFRDEDGKPNTAPGSGLRIELKDFACEELSRDMQGFLEIDSATLCGMLEQAEETYEMLKRKEGYRLSAIPASRKRRRERTPIEELDSGDDEGGQVHDESAKKQRRAIAHTTTQVRQKPSGER